MNGAIASPLRRRMLEAVAGLFLVTACAPSLPTGDDVAPGTYRVAMDERAGGYQRTYRLHVPAGIRGDGPRPLLVALHGGGSSGRILERRSGLNTLAARRGWLVAYPNGEGGLGLYRHWNAGSCCATGHIQDRDDVGFVRRVIENVSSRVAVDPSRVYLTGFSNGGMLAWRFAAEHPEQVAGVAAVAATFAGAKRGEAPPELPAAGRRVPLLLIYGLEDERIPPEDVENSLAAWLAGRPCSGVPRIRPIREGRVQLREWPGCGDAGPVTAWAIAGWGHRWPSLRRTRGNDALERLDAAEILGLFFSSEPHSTVLAPEAD